jgi:hypothetical protein
MIKKNDKEKKMLNSCLALLFVLLSIFIGYKDVRTGMMFLLIIAIVLVIYLEHSINST